MAKTYRLLNAGTQEMTGKAAVKRVLNEISEVLAEAVFHVGPHDIEVHLNLDDEGRPCLDIRPDGELVDGDLWRVCVPLSDLVYPWDDPLLHLERDGEAAGERAAIAAALRALADSVEAGHVVDRDDAQHHGL